MQNLVNIYDYYLSHSLLSIFNALASTFIFEKYCDFLLTMQDL